MNRNLRRAAWPAMLVAAALALGACTTLTREPPRSRPSIDPCADRLHDLAGHLLLYYSAHGRLPPTLDDLPAAADPGRPLSPVCPASGEPYVYRPDGLEVEGQPGRLVLYDAVPAHSGMGWAVALIEPTGDGPLDTRVILLPGQVIRAAELRARPGTGAAGQD